MADTGIGSTERTIISLKKRKPSQTRTVNTGGPVSSFDNYGTVDNDSM